MNASLSEFVYEMRHAFCFYGISERQFECMFGLHTQRLCVQVLEKSVFYASQTSLVSVRDNMHLFRRRYHLP